MSLINTTADVTGGTDCLFNIFMSKYIAFKGTYDKGYQIYGFDGSDWYLNISGNGHGFQKDETEKYSHSFLKAQTLEGIKEEVRIAEYKLIYGRGEAGDVKCPNCGFWHSFDYTNYNADGYYTPGIDESFSEGRACICGKKYIFKIKEVKVIWETKELTV